MTIVVSNSITKIPKKASMVSNLRIFICVTNFAIRQIQSFDFKYRNSFSKLVTAFPKHPNKAFLIPNLSMFVLVRKFAVRQSRGH